MFGVDWDMVAAIAQVLGFAGVIWGLAQNRRTLQTQVALEFYRRFKDIADRMPLDLRLSTESNRVWNEVAEPKRSQMLISMLSYLNLCSEEFGMYQRGRLPRDVWKVTTREIEGNFAHPLWRDIWRDVRGQYDSHSPFAAFIDAVVARQDRAAKV